jgi:hypothetical protein
MSRRNHKHGAAVLAFLAALMFPGCQDRNEFLWQIGCYVFGVYFIVLLITMALPKIHRLHWFQFLAECIKTPVQYLAGFVILGGVVIVGVGCSKWGADFGPEKLTILFGTMVLIAGANLLLWARSDSPEEKALRMKIVLMSVSFGMSLAYIMFGAQLIG